MRGAPFTVSADLGTLVADQIAAPKPDETEVGYDDGRRAARRLGTTAHFRKAVVRGFRVFKAHRRVYHSTLGSRAFQDLY